MWQETKHGLYKQFNFEDFKQAFAFMTKVAALAEAHNHHPRWENEWNVVQVWLITHEGGQKITDKDHEMAAAIDEISEANPAKLPPTPLGATVQHDEVIVYADGGSRGNPGPSASGFVVMDTTNKVLIDQGVYLGITTNNQAEYTALKLALEAAKKLGAKEVQVYMDSLLVINQMRGVFRVKNRDLWPIHDAIKQLTASFKKINFQHVPRELNKLADAAVNRALDDELGITNPHHLQKP